MAITDNAISLVALTEERFRADITSTTGSNKSLTPPSIDSVWNTLTEVHKHSSSSLSKVGAFVPSILSLTGTDSDTVGNKTSGPISLSSTETGQFLVELVRAAHDTANSNSCSSVLAGQGSESDEYGDVGLLLRTNAIDRTNTLKANAKAVLSSIGLDVPPSGGAQISPLSLSEETSLPETIEYSPDDAASQQLSGLVSKLDDPFAFTLDCSVDGGAVFYFLIGKLRTDDKPTWAGLLGVGTWSG